MKYRWLPSSFFFLAMGLLAGASAGSAAAQSPAIDPAMHVDDATLRTWLHSGDPRLVAWAADFARRNSNEKIIAEMPALLDGWSFPPVTATGESQLAQRRAASAVLDALIQQRARVPLTTINAVADRFPAQAAVMISDWPLTDSRGTLANWTYGTSGDWGSRELARVASMMLAKDPVPSRGIFNGELMGFVASVVADSQEELRVTIKSDDRKSPGSGSGSCGDSLGRQLPPGWPETFGYGLVENDPQPHERVVVDLGGDAIQAIRVAENRGSGSCYFVRPLDSRTRHELIAYWLGVTPAEMAWHPVKDVIIVWTDKDAYEKRLGEIVESQREILQGTSQALGERKLMNDNEVATIAPKLVVTVHCEIDPCPLK